MPVEPQPSFTDLSSHLGSGEAETGGCDGVESAGCLHTDEPFRQPLRRPLKAVDRHRLQRQGHFADSAGLTVEMVCCVRCADRLGTAIAAKPEIPDSIGRHPEVNQRLAHVFRFSAIEQEIPFESQA